MENDPYLSVIIPAYTEGERLGRTLLQIDHHLRPQDIDYEILVIVDGSPSHTGELAKNYVSRVKNLLVIENDKNKGKGYAVRLGLLQAKGAFRLYTDADGSTPIEHADEFLLACQNGFDVVMGSRDIEGAVIEIHQPRYRELMGDMGNLLIRATLGLWGYADTQCGFKMLSQHAAREIATRLMVDRFGFDFELIILAHKLGFKVKQMPVRWRHETGSSVTFFGPNGFTRILIDLVKTKYRLVKSEYNLPKQQRPIR
ncbi:MAG: glycosyltransferase family 2 protein [Desulfobacterales bacterium]|jgi:dolichyl-phosphate beta-glucosyltransferase